METLPIEVVESVTQYLTPQDLARCCAVSQEWRQIFNEDRLWRRHCDPTLEEYLRITPCVVQPVFEFPEVKDSTLIPICQGRMAFLREKHLKNNWKHENNREDKILKLKNECFIDFLTNDIAVRWCLGQIGLWDLSSVPAVVIAKTDCALTYPERPNPSNCLTVGTNLIVVGDAFAEVYNVDVMKKHIGLKHQLFFDEVGEASVNPNLEDLDGLCPFWFGLSMDKKCIAKDHKFIHINKAGSKLRVFDLDTGKQLKEESCPALQKQNKPDKFVKLICCETSDDIVVATSIPHLEPTDPLEQLMLAMRLNLTMQRPFSPGKKTFHFFIYSPKQLLFLPFTATSEFPNNECAINGEFFALRNVETLTVYNYHTSEVLLSLPGFSFSGLSTFKESFAYKDEETNTLILFFPADNHESKLAPHEKPFSFEITDNKYITLTTKDETKDVTGMDLIYETILSVWEGTGRSLEQSEIIVDKGWEINQVATKAVVDPSTNSNHLSVFHYW